MADNKSSLLQEHGKYFGTTSFTDGHRIFEPSEKDRFMFREARRNPKAVINRLIRQKGDPQTIVRLIFEYDLEDEFDDYLETA